MKVLWILSLMVCLNLVAGITKYDFNVCRIDNCEDEERNCISDESTCLRAFGETRKCFQECLSAEQLETYNLCWQNKCNKSGMGNALYDSLKMCYEQTCYLSGKIAAFASMLIILMMAI